MRVTILVKLVEMLLKQIDAEDVKKWVDTGLDVIEDKYKDVTMIIMTCNLIRASFDIPDND